MRLLLFLAFLVVPLLEIWVLIQVGQVIGGWATVGLLLAGALLGSWLVRREGRRVWRSLRESLNSGRVPDRELGDAALVVAGGMLMLTPGFVTDLVGFACVLPPTRPLVRAAARWFFAQRVRRLATSGSPTPFGPLSFRVPSAQDQGVPGSVIHGQVIREDGPARPPAADREIG